MSSYITFRPSDISLPGVLKISVTKNVFDKLTSASLDGEAVLTSLSSSSVLLLTNAQNDDEFELHTLNGVFFCRPSDDGDSLLLVGYGANTLIKQNNVLKNGVGFIVSILVVQIRLYNSYNISYDIANGKVFPKDSYIYKSGSKALQTICSEMARIKKEKNATKEDALNLPEYKPDKKLSTLLSLAENYSVLSSELEKNTVNSVGKISYRNLSSVNYDRTDRVAYAFDTDSLDESHFKVGVQIDIEDREGNRNTAEIIVINKLNSKTSKLTVLFSKHLDISILNSSGWFTLSFSTVNMDVQLEAIEKIRSGLAESKYMDNVLASSKPDGFTHKDLSQLETELSLRERALNKSQVDAIKYGIEANDVFLVMGPPGTGKTTVILEWVKYFVLKEHKRVLISSQNNKAVDNVLARIADEKNMDIIRIGSEGKIQSEVVPFMFENKISAKRKTIVTDTQNNINFLSHLANQWTSYTNALQILFSESSQIFNKSNAFTAFIKQYAVPLYNHLVALNNQNTNIVNQKKAVNASINKLYKAITSSRVSGNPIKRFIGKLLYNSRSSKMRELINKYNSICNQEYQTVSEYNRNIQELNRCLNYAYSTLYADYYRAYSLWQKKSFDIIARRPSINNIWNLFTNITLSTETLSQSDAFSKTMDYIKSEFARLTKIQSAIKNWQTVANDRQNYALNEIVLDSVNVVGATCIGINSQKRFADLKFDITIIDEAGQIQIHNALVPMSVSNKLIMLGDHKQIPPSVSTEILDVCLQNGISGELLEKSLFEKMYESFPESNKIMLDTQYRMPAEIADTISAWFYDKKYYSPAFKRDLPSLLPQLSSKPFVIIDTSHERNRFETKVQNAGSYNMLEANIVAKLMSYIYSNMPQFNQHELGIITGYNSQVKQILSLLHDITGESNDSEMVATVDSFQGQEREIIIYSFTKSSKESPKSKRIGFLNELRRINVAMTRCKKMLILIGDMHFLSSCEHMDLDNMQQPIYEKSEKQFSDFIKKMLNDINNGSGELIEYTEFIKRISE